jgi:hypothetical protein
MLNKNGALVFLGLLFIIASSGCIDIMEEICKNPEGAQEKLVCGVVKIDKSLRGTTTGDDADIDEDDVDFDPCSDLRGISKDQCLKDRAIVMENPSFCDEIKDLVARYRCFEDLAVEMRDPSMCESEKEQDIINDCYIKYFNEVEVDTRTCEKLKAPHSEICYGVIGLRDNDVSYCLLMSGKLRDKCLVEFAKKGDPTSCKNVQDTDMKELCVKNMYDRCVELHLKEECAIKAGIGMGDCDYINDATLRDACWARLMTDPKL